MEPNANVDPCVPLAVRTDKAHLRRLHGKFRGFFADDQLGC